ncbi:MAG: flavin reductase family protein [Chitinophagaceae bacterium]|jgi:flavin reductase (DIM6/NTAB) family NADH-FMN oxidoreductase RutF|nr:MAG: flavin reductase family protein [Chitinophagaceae bacterium]
MQIEPGRPDGKKFYQLLTGSIAPRPIAFASTMDKGGNPNLSPFSFFNGFGSNPATLIFSPMRRVRNNTIKHTLGNIHETMEVVINTVNYDMVQQVSLSSCEYPREVNEFVKSGLTPVPSVLVKPYRVKESPVSFECKVKQIIETGDKGGAGNLIICEAILIHVKDEVMDENGYINPHKIDLVGRMGLNYYCRASGNAVFEVPKPNTELGIGFDSLPESVRKSNILSGNDLGMLANVTEIPVIDPAFEDVQLKNIIQYYSTNPEDMEIELHYYAKKLLEQNRVRDAWQVLLAGA